MRKIVLYAAMFIFLVLSVPNLPAGSKTPDDEVSVIGILHLGSIPSTPHPPGSTHQSGPLPNETGYWLRLYQPIYVNRGSKSETSTDIVVLRVPENLREATVKLGGRRVVVEGTMNCRGGWYEGATCFMDVRQIELGMTQ